jgi:signal peptidase I
LSPDTDPARPAASASTSSRPAPVQESKLGWLGELLRAWGPAILAVILIRTFIFEPFRIPSGSMVPTLLIGDHVVVTKFSYGVWLPWPFPSRELVDLGDPDRGDIIVFRYPVDETTNYIKRVVAIPGDKIRVQDNRIYLNGVEQPTVRDDNFTFIDQDCRTHVMRQYTEDLSGAKHPILTNTGLGGSLSDMKEIEVPAGKVFVMGDNRDNSEDSRRWKFVDYSQIKGKAHRIWLSWDGCAGGSLGRIRTDRFMQNLYGSPAAIPAPPPATTTP